MLSYCLKCNKKNTESIDSKFLQLVMIKQRYYQNMLYVVLKNQNLLKKKKQKDY